MVSSIPNFPPWNPNFGQFFLNPLFEKMEKLRRSILFSENMLWTAKMNF